MKKNMIVRNFCTGLIFLALLLTQNISVAQEGSGEKADQEIEDNANTLHSAKEGFHEATQKVTDAAQPSFSNWENILPDGVNFKMLPAKVISRFSISLSGSLPLGDINSQYVPLNNLQAAVFAPGTIEHLFEQMQGKFFIGSLSGQSAQNIEMRGSTQAMPGLRLGLRLGNRLELRAGGHFFQSKWSGNFPVVVFSEQQHPSQAPKTLQGALTASSSGVLAQTDLAYFFTNGTIRPFVQGGIRGQFPTQNESGATLAGVALPLETTPLRSSFSPFGGAGLRVGFLKNGFVEASASYGIVPGAGYAPSVGLWVGWLFGGRIGMNPKMINAKAKQPHVTRCGCGTFRIYNDIWAKDEETAKRISKERLAKEFICPTGCPETYDIVEPVAFMKGYNENRKQVRREDKPGIWEYRWIVKLNMKCTVRV